MHGYDIREYNMAMPKRFTLEPASRGRYRVVWTDDTKENAEERDIALPGEVSADWEVCDCCGGHGTCVDPAVDADGLTAEDFADDPGFRDDYFGGVYDITCPACAGRRVVPAPRLTKEVKEFLADLAESDHRLYMECLYERRMGY